jgi:hypothetical protein
VFAITIEKMAMEGVEQVAKDVVGGDCLEDYNEVQLHMTIVLMTQSFTPSLGQIGSKLCN